jgi:hypothetical protein
MGNRLCLIFRYSTLRARDTAYGIKGRELRQSLGTAHAMRSAARERRALADGGGNVEAAIIVPGRGKRHDKIMTAW